MATPRPISATRYWTTNDDSVTAGQPEQSQERAEDGDRGDQQRQAGQQRAEDQGEDHQRADPPKSTSMRTPGRRRRLVEHGSR